MSTLEAPVRLTEGQAAGLAVLASALSPLHLVTEGVAPQAPPELNAKLSETLLRPERVVSLAVADHLGAEGTDLVVGTDGAAYELGRDGTDIVSQQSPLGALILRLGHRLGLDAYADPASSPVERVDATTFGAAVQAADARIAGSFADGARPEDFGDRSLSSWTSAAGLTSNDAPSTAPAQALVDLLSSEFGPGFPRLSITMSTSERVEVVHLLVGRSGPWIALRTAESEVVLRRVGPTAAYRCLEQLLLPEAAQQPWIRVDADLDFLPNGIIISLEAGEDIRVCSVSDDWIEIETRAGARGWIPAASLDSSFANSSAAKTPDASTPAATPDSSQSADAWWNT